MWCSEVIVTRMPMSTLYPLPAWTAVGSWVRPLSERARWGVWSDKTYGVVESNKNGIIHIVVYDHITGLPRGTADLHLKVFQHPSDAGWDANDWAFSSRQGPRTLWERLLGEDLV